jgi:hypothetical protein
VVLENVVRNALKFLMTVVKAAVFESIVTILFWVWKWSVTPSSVTALEPTKAATRRWLRIWVERAIFGG